MLVLGVLFLVAIDVIIIIIYTTIEGIVELRAESIVNPENPRQEQGVRNIRFGFWSMVNGEKNNVSIKQPNINCTQTLKEVIGFT